MSNPSTPHNPAGPRRHVRSGAILATAAVAGAAVAVGAGLASASTSHPTVAAANNSGLHEKVLVDSHGFTLYELSPETTHHLLCKSSACLGFWPPLKASSAKAKLVKGAGVKGKLGTMRRHGFFQVTLDGRPLYRFSVETAKGQSKGQGIHGFGGVWHVVREGAATTTSTQTTTTPMTTTSTSSTYSIPGY
jgi:predicted lipoprotein with Yx(FWY)xxD motif